jgi:hypothetical protein
MPKRITLLVDEDWYHTIKNVISEVYDNEICEILAVEEVEFMPCNTCGTDVPADIHAEELGFCVPCQHAYFQEAEV